MQEPITITSFTAENFKRLKVVELQLDPKGLTIIGGKNRQGKTSILDGIAFALGGAKFKPSNPNHDGGESNAAVSVTLSNGLVVSRKGKNGALKVTKDGMTGSQGVLDEMVSEFALDLPKIMNANERDRSALMLGLLAPELKNEIRLNEVAEKEAFESRAAVNRDLKRAQALHDSIIVPDDAPHVKVEMKDLQDEYKAALKEERKINELRATHQGIVTKQEMQLQRRALLHSEIEKLQQDLDLVLESEVVLEQNIRASRDEFKKASEEQADPAAIMEKMDAITKTNEGFAKREEAKRTKQDVGNLESEAFALTETIEEMRAACKELVEKANLPLPEMSIDSTGRVLYCGNAWDCMSTAEQIRVAFAIAAKLRPSCGFVLIDKGESLDAESLAELDKLALESQRQIIMTRVSTGEECGIIIEDGAVV